MPGDVLPEIRTGNIKLRAVKYSKIIIVEFPMLYQLCIYGNEEEKPT